MAKANARQQFLFGIPRFVVELSLVAGAMALFIFLYLSGPPEVWIGQLFVFLGGAFRAIGAVLPIQTNLANLRSIAPQAAAALELLNQNDQEKVNDDFLSESAESSEFSTLQEGPYRGTHLRCVGVSFTYPGDNLPTLGAFDLTVEPGTLVALIGPSGSGKSTLADLLVGLLRPTLGRVLLDGVDARKAVLQERISVGYVPQSPTVFEGSVAENLTLRNPSTFQERSLLISVLERASLSPGESTGALNPESRVSSESLSGGQKQRLAIARQLLRNPRLLVLDEATSSLDLPTEKQISDVLVSLKGGMTTVVVAHRLSTVIAADKILVVEDGRVEEFAGIEDLKRSSIFGRRAIELQKWGLD